MNKKPRLHTAHVSVVWKRRRYLLSISAVSSQTRIVRQALEAVLCQIGFEKYSGSIKLKGGK